VNICILKTYFKRRRSRNKEEVVIKDKEQREIGQQIVRKDGVSSRKQMRSSPRNLKKVIYKEITYLCCSIVGMNFRLSDP
jgi:hypothetical protein